MHTSHLSARVGAAMSTVSWGVWVGSPSLVAAKTAAVEWSWIKWFHQSEAQSCKNGLELQAGQHGPLQWGQCQRA